MTFWTICPKLSVVLNHNQLKVVTIMELNYFKDKLFDLLNETNELDIAGLNVEDRTNRLTVTMADGSKFKILCKTATL